MTCVRRSTMLPLEPLVSTDGFCAAALFVDRKTTGQ